MRKVLLDSSVWISLFAKDKNYAKAYEIIVRLLADDSLIIIPTLVYIEVINNLYRLKASKGKIAAIEHYFQNDKKIHLCHTTSSFWLNEIASLSELITLKSHDLIILAHSLKYDAQLISFDKKMNQAYNMISSHNN